MLQRFRLLQRFSTKIPRRSLLMTSHTHSSCPAAVPTIGTHNGQFHCDEVLACCMLKKLPRFANAQIIRTRDGDVLKTCDIVVDVGSVYDPANQRFDHHQKSFDHSMSTVVPGKPWITKLSSAGLIYAHFGREVLKNLTSGRDADELDEESLEKLYDKVYEDFIQAIDAIDNGICINEYPMAYKVTTDLSSRVGHLNPGWKDKHVDEQERFSSAMKLVSSEFEERVLYYVDYWLDAYNIVRDAIESRFEVHPSGEIIEFPLGGVPWKDHLSKLEVSLGIETPIQYVIFPDGKGKWRVQCVPVDPKSFINRTSLYKEWQGLRDDELKEISGIPTIDFVHATGFIGGAAERSCVLAMAKESLRHKSS